MIIIGSAMCISGNHGDIYAKNVSSSATRVVMAEL